MPSYIDNSDEVDRALDRTLEELAILLHLAREAVPGPTGQRLDEAADAIRLERERRSYRGKSVGPPEPYQNRPLLIPIPIQISYLIRQLEL